MAANGSFQNSFGPLKCLSRTFQTVNDRGHNRSKDRDIEGCTEKKNIVPSCCHDSINISQVWREDWNSGFSDF